MRFTPKSETQIQSERFPLLKPGKYNFEIVDAKDDVSKKGNDMIVLRIKLLDGGLNFLTFINDYLMESIPYKLRHACYACGIGNQYEMGELKASSFIGKSGTLDLIIQKDKSGQYPDKNSVNDYCVESAPSQAQGPGSWDEMPEMPEWVK